MAAGRYRHRITIKQTQRTTDADGLPVNSWQLFARVWADVVLSGQGQAIHHQQQQSHTGTVFQIRWSPLTARICPSMRIEWDGGVYNIESAERGEGPRRIIVIQATAVRSADG